MCTKCAGVVEGPSPLSSQMAPYAQSSPHYVHKMRRRGGVARGAEGELAADRTTTAALQRWPHRRLVLRDQIFLASNGELGQFIGQLGH